MYDSETCDECMELFLDPKHLKAWYPEDKFVGTLSYRRNLERLISNTRLGCLFFSKLVNWFQLDSDFWDGFLLSLSKDNHKDVVFSMNMPRLKSDVLMICVAAGENLIEHSNYLALALLASPGTY